LKSKSVRIHNIREDTLKYCNRLFESITMFYNFRLKSSSQPGVVRAIAFIIENLIYKQSYEKEYRYFLISLNSANYTYQRESLSTLLNFSLSDIRHALKILKFANIINVQIGHRKYTGKDNKDEWVYDKDNAKLTTIRLNLVEQWNKEYIGLSYLDIGLMLSYSDPTIEKWHAILREKEKKKRGQKKAKVLQEVRLSKKYEKDIQQINRYLRKKELPGYQRIYSCEQDGKGNRVNLGYGRIYNPFQQISKAHRALICEEQGWKEYDIKSCLANILYCIETGEKYNGDLYHDAMKACGIQECDFSKFREVFKKIFIIFFNIEEKEAFQAINNVLYEEKLFQFKAEEIIQKIVSTFPVFDKYFFTKSSCLTQFLESKIAIEIMMYCIKNDILPLSIHDSYVFPVECYNELSSFADSVFDKVIHEFVNSDNCSSLQNFNNPCYSFILDNYFNKLSSCNQEPTQPSFNIFAPFDLLSNIKNSIVNNIKTNQKNIKNIRILEHGFT
jgi:hypothetical protein